MAYEPMEFEQLPDGSIRPKRVPSSSVYGERDGPSLIERAGGALRQMFMNEAQAQSEKDRYMGIGAPRSPANQPTPAAAQSTPASSPPAAPAPAPSAPAVTPSARAPEASAPAEAMPAPPQEAVDEIAEKARRAPKDVKRMIEQKAPKGFDFDAAYDQWVEKFGGYQKPEGLSRQEKGLFLMEFGLRMMEASTRKSGFGAMGEAGAATLQGLRGEMTRRETTATANNADIRQRALMATQQEGIQARADAENERQRLADFYRGTQGEWTKDGFALIKPDGTVTMAKGPDGNLLKPGKTPNAASSRPSVNEFLYEKLVKQYGEKKGLAILRGASTPEEWRNEGEREVTKDMGRIRDNQGKLDLPDGTSVRWSASSPAQREQYRQWFLQRWMAAWGDTDAGGGIAAAAQAEQVSEQVTRPAGIDEY